MSEPIAVGDRVWVQFPVARVAGTVMALKQRTALVSRGRIDSRYDYRDVVEWVSKDRLTRFTAHESAHHGNATVYERPVNR